MLIVLLSAVALADLPAAQHQDIQAVVTQGRGSAAGRAAWKRLSASGPAVLPHLLSAMDTKDIVVANWLRTAFDRVVERDLKTGGTGIAVEALIDFIKDSRHAGRARRFALELVDMLKPGTSKQIAADRLDDPEFRYEAVALAIENAQALLKSDEKKAARAFHSAFTAARDVQQARDAAKGLLDLGIKVSVAEHLGFLLDWYVLGPFDGHHEQGFRTVYEPEKGVDLAAEYDGKAGKIRWKRYRAQEPPPSSRGKNHVVVDLQAADALGKVDDAVGFAYTEIIAPRAGTFEFRGAADDNLTVWVNGQRAFGFEEWRNGVRHDRHRFTVQLREGKNAILVKVCQSEPYIAPNWEFFLRIVDATGTGVAFPGGLK